MVYAKKQMSIEEVAKAVHAFASWECAGAANVCNAPKTRET